MSLSSRNRLTLNLGGIYGDRIVGKVPTLEKTARRSRASDDKWRDCGASQFPVQLSRRWVNTFTNLPNRDRFDIAIKPFDGEE